MGETRPRHNRKLLIFFIQINRISKHQVLAQLCIFKSGGTWVKAIGLKDRNPFTQRVFQKASYVLLQLNPLRMWPEGFGFEIIQVGILSHCSRQIVKNTNLIHSCILVHQQQKLPTIYRPLECSARSSFFYWKSPNMSFLLSGLTYIKMFFTI